MKIDSSALSMDASTGHTEVKKSGRGIVALGAPGGTQQNFSLNFVRPGLLSESFHLNRQVTEATAQSEVLSTNQATEELLTGMVEGVLDKKVKLKLDEGLPDFSEIHEGTITTMEEDGGEVTLGASSLQVAFSSHTMEYEHQYVHVASEGAVTTSDGRSIDFSLNLRMERESFSYHSLSIEASEIFLDPLVLNFDTSLNVLAETSFSFDLNGDGVEESLAGLGEGSGFLALDVNGDKEINNGLELFGPMTGHGFGELAVHDVDDNLWIDENDPIFDDLMVWMNAGTESESLVSLREAGVGAISLANTETLFDLKDKNNRTLAQVTASGLFLTEEGEVRSLQEVEFATPDEEGTEGQSFVSEEPVTTLSQAMETLQFLLTRHRQRVQAMVNRRIAEQSSVRDNERLQDKFWQWQEGESEKV